MNIADRIQHLRKVKGISQEELADKIGVSRQAVSKWESEQSIPDIDKIILLSDFFDVTTDYILKGIETKKQTDEKGVDANTFVVISCALNMIGLIVSSALWYEEQTPMAIVAGLILMVVGCMVFGVGLAHSTQNVTGAKLRFLAINIWVLSFIPMSMIYNALFSFTIAPYPLALLSYGSLNVFFFFAIAYLALCFGVTFWALRKIRRMSKFP